MRRLLRRLVLVLFVIVAVPLAGSRWLGWGQADPSVLPPEGRPILIAGDQVVNVVETGTGRGSPVFLVHGLPSCAADWAGLPAKLAALGHRVIAYDRIGFGYSSRPADTGDRYTVESNARDLLALMDALAIKRAALVGWSYGGGVVQELAGSNPERVSHLVLVGSVGPDAAAREPSPLDVIVGTGIGAPILEWFGAAPILGRTFTQKNLVEAFAGEANIPDGWLDYTRGMLALPGTLNSFVSEMQKRAPWGRRSRAVRAPSLIIHGDDDRLVPATAARALHDELSSSRLQIVAAGSHMLPVTHPTLLAKSIHQHVASK